MTKVNCGECLKGLCISCRNPNTCLCAETDEHKEKFTKSEHFKSFTDSSLCDAIKNIINKDHELVAIIDTLWTIKHPIFRWDPSIEKYTLDAFLSNESRYKMALRRAIREISQLRHPWMPIEDSIEFINNCKIEFTDSKMVKMGEWGPQHSGLALSTDCVILQLGERETYTVTAHARCFGNCTSNLQLEVDPYSRKLQPPPICAEENCSHYGNRFYIEPKSIKTEYCQKIMIQEPMEEAKNGSPIIFECELTGDDVYDAYIGQRKRVIGVFTSVEQKREASNKILIKCASMSEGVDTVPLMPETSQITMWSAMAKDSDSYMKLLIKSFAPELYKDDQTALAVTAILMSLVRGTTVDRLRGDIHSILVGDPSCLVSGSRVVLGNGTIKTIEKLGVNHLEPINQQILTGLGGKHRAYAKVFHKYEKQKVIEVITESGKHIIGTYNHPLQKIESNIRSWVRLDKLKVGDKLTTTSSIPCTIKIPIKSNFTYTKNIFGPKYNGNVPKIIDKNLAAIFGYVTGDGLVRKKEVGFVVNEEEQDLIPKLLKCFELTFNTKPYVVIREPKTREYKGVMFYGKQYLTYVSYYSFPVAEMLYFLRDKRVPSLIFESGNDIVAEFLRWLFEADGSVFTLKRGSGSVQLKSVRNELLQDVQMLLLRFGIHSRINQNNLIIRRGKDIVRFIDQIGFVSKKKRDKSKKVLLLAKKKGYVNRSLSEKIVKIIHHKEPQTVYDIEVPKYNRFIANGIISHNTGKTKLLEFLILITQKSSYVNGRMASGPGLTIGMDTLAGGKRAPRAGAIPLCDEGFVAMDEMGRAKKDDITAMHESMESGFISFTKAAYNFKLKARTTIIGAANPVSDVWDDDLSPAENINLPTTILSRCDFIVNLRDKRDDIIDQNKMQHVLKMRRGEGDKNLIGIEDFTKLLNYVRMTKPKMTTDAEKKISEFFHMIRKITQEKGSRPIDTRLSESLIRISTAIAKLHFSQEITDIHAEHAIELVKKSFHTLNMKVEEGQIIKDTQALVTTKEQAIRKCAMRLEAVSTEEKFFPYDDLIDLVLDKEPEQFDGDKNKIITFVDKHMEKMFLRRGTNLRLSTN